MLLLCNLYAFIFVAFRDSVTKHFGFSFKCVEMMKLGLLRCPYNSY